MDVSAQILLVTFPAQGHINPSLQFAKRLVEMGVQVTFLMAISAVNRITKSAAAPQGITFLGFSDGYDDGFIAGMDFEVYMTDLRRRGSEAVATAITASRGNGKPIVHVVYTTLLPWVSHAAHDLHVPSTLLWIQPATILDIYYYSFYGYGDVLSENKISDPSWSIELPGLPRLTGRDLPSFLCAANAYKSPLPLYKEHIDTLDEEKNPKILVNSFNALESKALQAIKKLNFVAIGPLILSAFLDGKDPSDISFGGDLLEKSKDYIDWLDSKPRGSVIYVAFGSTSVLEEKQSEEVARGLLDCGRPFLWVMGGKGNEMTCRARERENLEGCLQGGRFGYWMMASTPVFRRGSWANSDGRTEDNRRDESCGDLAVIEGGGGLADDSVINLNGKSLKLGDLIKGNYHDKGRKDFERGIGAQTDMSGSVGLGGLGGRNGGDKGILMLGNNNMGLELEEQVGRSACVLGLEKVINKESGGQSMEGPSHGFFAVVDQFRHHVWGWKLLADLGIYPSTDMRDPRDLWVEVSQLVADREKPWVIMGDFNAITSNNEKLGGRDEEEWELRDFKDFIGTNQLIDIGYVGHSFTWSNKRGGSQNIRIRLDGALVNAEWRIACPDGVLRHLHPWRSDH
ncbi:hypothetical protein RHSIM_Rhsim02G0067400 [Rhododendron simsii]|uniref:Endonuclease/exonuclease/phosphatase domain-containing protein n=1 Tax=Rhododendron simsii TaxID=118357 RepID=A0A834HAR8_RHOSS|nr:hypothetical protein RHSIM_Rhsim02G0067400 [Rhododendron simsii]